MERLPTIRQLQHLSALAREQHFGRAAGRANVTQSTLSASIKELEDVLGGPVADRSGRQIHLTPLGKMIAEKSGRILADLTELAVVAREQAAPLGGMIRLGVIPTVSPFLLPRLLPGLRQRYPKLKVYLREDQTAHLLESLEQGELDVALLALPCDCTGETAVLARDRFVVALPKDHPLADVKSISAHELREAELLTLQDGHCLRDQVLQSCGLRPASGESYAATSLLTLVQMVDNGLGITLLPQMAVKAGILSGTGLVTRPAGSATAFRDIALLWRKGSARSGEMRLLATELKRLIR
jgi:LysR family hydrogen peroxide-inducible transcriptional activator